MTSAPEARVRIEIDVVSLVVDLGVQQLPLSAFRPESWRNSQGITRTLAHSRDWRVSVATVTDGATFSRYPGIDRTFIPFAPESIELWASSRLRPGIDGAIRFDGDLPVSARVPAGEALAVNVMLASGTGALVAHRDGGLLRLQITPTSC